MTRLLTVLMPTLNAESFLPQALDSLAGQTFQDFDVLVVDAGSTDRTLDLVQDYRRVRARVVRSGRVGLGAQLRLGLDGITAKYVARMDADDVSEPGRFEALIATLENRSELAMVGSQIGLLIGDKRCRAGALPQQHELIRSALLDGFPAFCHPSVMFRAEAARRCNAYAIPGSGEDLDFYLRMTEAGKGENLAAVLHQYRIHERSVSFAGFDEVQRNYRYAVACARARGDGAAEPTIAEYTSTWNRRGSGARLAGRLECVGTRLYRKSRIRLAEGQRLRGLAGAVASVLVRPRLVRARAMIRWGMWREAAKLA
jgi:glycosyltransferase involved in cell wall biosynthesis